MLACPLGSVLGFTNVLLNRNSDSEGLNSKTDVSAACWSVYEANTMLVFSSLRNSFIARFPSTFPAIFCIFFLNASLVRVYTDK